SHAIRHYAGLDRRRGRGFQWAVGWKAGGQRRRLLPNDARSTSDDQNQDRDTICHCWPPWAGEALAAGTRNTTVRLSGTRYFAAYSCTSFAVTFAMSSGIWKTYLGSP